ncbi:hypothetical protein PENCOP_c003G03800 [Penicillium coprophilum]|uniref:Fungal N-terminal domain-containing protein n=1 Tax=Penicillium coprophilum TaxID=36646 RepID=A0A1V6UZW3_9EURO|nr:hypothetical protein PENCOP_c003G03800 [Penicillium coprophilum]
MDPLSIAASITGIVSVCLKVAGSLDNLRSKLRRAHLTITALTSQCGAIKTGLSELQTMVPQSHIIREWPEIIATIDTTLTGCMVVLSCFENTLDKLQADDTDSGRSRISLILRWRSKTRIIWNEDEMRGYISLLQGQQSALTFLVQVLHMESMDGILEKIRNGRGLLDKQAVKAESLRQMNPQVHLPDSVLGLRRSANTIFGDMMSMTDDQDFDFDNAVINSKSYRRAMAMAKEVILNRDKVATKSTSESRQSIMSPETVSVDTGAELQSTELDSLKSIPTVRADKPLRGIQNVPSPSGISGTPQPAVADISFETVQDEKTQDDKIKDTKLAIRSAEGSASTSVFANVRELIARRRLAQITEHANVFAGYIIVSPELVVQILLGSLGSIPPQNGFEKLELALAQQQVQPRAADGTLEQLQPLKMRADEVCRLLQMLRFSLVCHRERLGVIHEG